MDQNALAADRLTYSGVVQSWHCDHMGHMNVTWYVAKFDEATWSFFARLGLTRSYMQENRCGMAAVEQNLKYLRELYAGDVVEIRTRMLELRERVVRFRHEMTLAGTGTLAATADMTTVHLDTVRRKAMAFPAAVREAAERLSGQ